MKTTTHDETVSQKLVKQAKKDVRRDNFKKDVGQALDTITGHSELEVRTYKTNGELRRGLKQMGRLGYKTTSHTTARGFWTHRRIHTVVFERSD